MDIGNWIALFKKIDHINGITNHPNGQIVSRATSSSLANADSPTQWDKAVLFSLRRVLKKQKRIFKIFEFEVALNHEARGAIATRGSDSSFARYNFNDARALKSKF